VVGIDTNRGFIKTKKVAWWPPATAHPGQDGGCPLPIESHPLQALVSEPLKPDLPTPW
jgi:sarcosine oxidase, subunit beta